jgi:hypothetical protein
MNTIDDILINEFNRLMKTCETQDEYSKFIEKWIVIWKIIYENNKLSEKIKF